MHFKRLLAFVVLFYAVSGQEWRVNEVKKVVQKSFGVYKAKVWGLDELKPVSNTAHDWLSLGATIVSSLDTMYIMGLKDEFAAGLEWVRNGMDLKKHDDLVNVFEVVIRIMGGLLGAYELSRESILLTRAIELADTLSPAFTAVPSCLPCATVNLASGAVDPHLNNTNLAMAGTLQLEFRYLSFVTGIERFRTLADRALNCTLDWADPNGLFPIFWSPKTGQPVAPFEISMDGDGDSFYEYLLKQYLQTGQTEPRFLEVFERALKGMEAKLYATTSPSKFGYVGRLKWIKMWEGPTFIPKWGHLSCFLGGMLILYERQVNHNPPPDMAKEIGRTCYHMYNGLAQTISGETLQAVEGKDFEWTQKDNLLRPEAIETLTYLYWTTGDDMYRTWAWDMFQRFLNFTRLPDGTFSGLLDISQPSSYDDLQQAYFFSETVKYFYLIFSPPFDNGRLPFDRFVLTTEAHPLRLFASAHPTPDGPSTPRSYPDLFGGSTERHSSKEPYITLFFVVLCLLVAVLAAVVLFEWRWKTRTVSTELTDRRLLLEESNKHIEIVEE